MRIVFFSTVFFIALSQVFAEKKPNIVWICIEDASPHIGCYGELAIKTPIMDNMADEGVKFEKAYVTAPVCSASRSAMVTGMYQMTSGFHLHRSQRISGKGGGNSAYYKSYEVPREIVTVPELFKQAGYYTSNKTKTDYNFTRKGLYDSTNDWSKRKEGQPFFAQFQLTGGKDRSSSKGVDQSKVKLPPYYANDEVLINDWVNYLGSWVRVDRAVGQILKRLKDEGELEDTYVFLWTDHGVSHIRGKQFLYEEGVAIPLLVRFPHKKNAGVIRADLVTHIDIPVTSLALAGIDTPDYMQGKSLFEDGYLEQKTIFFGRDRCDETVDVIRGLRTENYKYIRNYLPQVSHLQPSQYKDAKRIISRSRQLFDEGKLNELQSKPFLSSRPVEELYDLKNDPFETNNLALDERYVETVRGFRKDLRSWMTSNNDMGLIPEPILEDLGREHGNKYSVLKQSENKALIGQIIEVVEAGEKGDVAVIGNALNSSRPSIRYWAARAVGERNMTSLKEKAQLMLVDDVSAVRIAAAESLIQLGGLEKGGAILKSEVNNTNLIAGMYALRAIEAQGIKLKGLVGSTVKKAQKSKYEFSRRIARRLTALWEL